MKNITICLCILFAFSKTQGQTTVYYDDFRFATVSGYQGFATDDPDALGISTLFKRLTTDGLPDETTVLGYTRPANNIGARTDTRDQRYISMEGHGGGANYTGTTWAVTDAVDISSAPNMTITFAARYRFRSSDGDADPVPTILIAKNYTDGTSPDDPSITWIDVTSQVTKISDGTPYADTFNWAAFSLNASSYIPDSGSDKFAIAFKYEFSAGANPFGSTNRNGQWSISDVRYVEDSPLLSIADNTVLNEGIKVYPNPVQNELNISIANDININEVKLINILSSSVYSSNKVESIDVSNFSKGVYFLKITSENNGEITKKVVIK